MKEHIESLGSERDTNQENRGEMEEEKKDHSKVGLFMVLKFFFFFN